jgi:riboflavin biosynthesis pyrimidine reductase
VAGANPQPVVLDSTLRTPLDAALLSHPRGLWILTTERSGSDAHHALAARGAEVVVLPTDEVGRVSLSAALAALHARGMRSVMVEGGAHVLESFVAGHLAHYAVITLAPRLVGGLHAYHAGSNGALPRLAQVAYTPAGEDLIVWGEPVWGQPAIDKPVLTPEPA